MACARVRPVIRRLRGPSCGGLARLIRWPTGTSISKGFSLIYLIFVVDSSIGTLIKTELIPAIAYLRKTYPLRVSIFFPADFLEIFCVDPDLDCTNLTTTDIFFDSIYLYKLSFSFLLLFRSHWIISSDFIKIRDWDSWSACAPFIAAPSYSLDSLHEEISMSTKVVDQTTRLSLLPTPSSGVTISSQGNSSSFIPYPNWDVPMYLPNLTTTETNYNPKATKNLKVIFRKMDQENCWKVTEDEWTNTKKCKYPRDLPDFTKAVCFIFAKDIGLSLINWWLAPKTIEQGI